MNFMQPPMDEATFWESSPQRRYLRDFARHNRTAPDAVLGIALTLVAVDTPPNVVMPALVGSREAPLAMYTAIMGGSGDGKGIATGDAYALIPDLLDTAKEIPASGEGVESIFAGRRPVPGGEGTPIETEQYCITQRALLDVSEIKTLQAAMSRQGSKLDAVLLSAWCGEQLGAKTKSVDGSLKLPRLGYKLCIITGVQPDNMEILTARDGDGLPQRFLWCDTADYGAPRLLPPMPQGTFRFDVDRLKAYQADDMAVNALYRAGSIKDMPKMEDGSIPYRLYEMQYPSEVYAAVDEDAYNRLHRSRPNGMDAHALQLAMRLAALLAILEQRENLLEVTVDDWNAALWLMRHSIETRERCLAKSREISKGKRADRIIDDMGAKDLAQQRIHDKCVRFCIENIPAKLQEKDPDRIGIAQSTLKKCFNGKWWDGYDEALETLKRDGVIEERSGERHGVRYALANR